MTSTRLWLARLLVALCCTSCHRAALAQPLIAGRPYAKLETRQATRGAMLKQFTGVSLEWGEWHILAPWPHPSGAKGIAPELPPELVLGAMAAGAPGPDLTDVFELPSGQERRWRIYTQSQDIGGLGGLRPVNLLDGLAPDERNKQVGYLYRTITVDEPVELPVSVGSDDGLRLWFNTERLIDADVERSLDPESHRVVLKLRPGLNHLFAKVSQGAGDWQFSLTTDQALDPVAESALEHQLDEDFPDAESAYYRIVTIPVPPPPGEVVEVGGIDVLPDGRPILSTRRGDIFIIENAYDLPPINARWKRFASGLHEPLGLAIRPDSRAKSGVAVYTVQRAELTRLVDTDGDDAADLFETVCDDWLLSGNYHEFAFGPKFDRQGNAWVTLNLAHSDDDGTVMGAPVSTRGWAVRISPDGVMERIADGLRSPDGIGMFSDGEMFYTDNQGDYVATCKLSHLSPGSFHGHQASLKLREGWADWRRDGKPVPEITPPAVWFPYQKMGQSASDILLDDRAGKFGPFDGQLFVGDQTHATVMRVFLEKFDGADGKPVYQGACFAFKAGFASGVHRLAWGWGGAPDSSMLIGMTDRGWGSTGPKRFGVQRLIWTGRVPLEIERMHALPDGFELHFTLPVDDSAADPSSYTMSRYAYLYRPDYGSPEIDTASVPVTGVTRIDGRTIRLHLAEMRTGYVHELDASGVRAVRAAGSEEAEGAGLPLLHPKAYYTLQYVPPEEGGAKAGAMPETEFVTEMAEMFPGMSPPSPVEAGDEQGFRGAWERIRDSIEPRVTPARLAAISRWSVSLMGSYQPEPGWTRNLPMKPIGSLNGLVLFGQEAQASSIALPSERPIVHRRLVVAAAYDRSAKSIARVVVSIRGWAEE